MANVNTFMSRFWNAPINWQFFKHASDYYNQKFHAPDAAPSIGILNKEDTDQPNKRHEGVIAYEHQSTGGPESHNLRYQEPELERGRMKRSIIPPDFEQSTENSRLPLSTSRAEMMTFKREGDTCEKSTLSMTESMIWRLNLIFRSESQIFAYSKRYDELDQADSDLRQIVNNMNRKVENMTTWPALEDELNDLEEAREIKRDLDREMEEVKAMIKSARNEQDLAKTELFAEFKDVLGRYNLLASQPDDEDPSVKYEEVPENEGNFNSHESPSYQQLQCRPRQQEQDVLTTSQAARAAEVLAKNIALNELNRTEDRVAQARTRVDTWADYYAAEYAHFLEGICNGTIDVATTVFDNPMLMDQQDATRDLTQAEKEYEAAQEKVRKLDTRPYNHRDSEPESTNGIDIGYDIELEEEWVARVDRMKIHRWMENKDSDVHPSVVDDDWDVRSVGLSDSISLIAEGLERKMIDRWHVMCEQQSMKV